MAITATEAGSLSVLSQLADGTLITPYKWLSLQNNALDGSYHPLPIDGSYQVGWWGATLSDSNGLVSTNPTVTFTFPSTNVGVFMVYGDNMLNEYPVDFDYVVKNASNAVLGSGSVVGNSSLGCVTYLATQCVGATSIAITIKRINNPNTVPKLLEIGIGAMIVTTDIITPNIEETLCNASFTRSGGAYNIDGSYVPSGPRYAPGKFGKALITEEGTVNLLTANQASIETDLTGITTAPPAGTTLTRDTTTAWQGSASVKVVNDGTLSDQGVCTAWVPVTPSQTYTFSVYVKGSGNISVRLRDGDSNWTTIGDSASSTVILTGNWQRISVTRTFASNAVNAFCQIRTVGAQAVTFWVDGLQLEQKSCATSWTINTRNIESISIPTDGVLNPQQGTIEAFVYVNANLKDTSANRYIFSSAIGTVGPYSNSIALAHYMNNFWYVWVTDANGNQTAISIADTLSTGWHQFVVRWSSASLDFFIDGVKQGTKANPSLPSAFSSTLMLGQWQWTYGWINTYIEDIRVSDIARTDAEITTGYSSNQPLPVDSYTAAKMNCEGNLDVVAGNVGWVTNSLSDTEILAPKVCDFDDTASVGRNWMRNTSGFKDMTNWVLSMGPSQTGLIELVDDPIKGKVLHVTKTNSVSWWVVQHALYNYFPQKFDVTKQYTISFDIRSANGTYFYVAFMDGNGTNKVLDTTLLGNISTTWARVTKTFTPLIAGNGPMLYLTGSVDEYWITNVKLEIGSAATDWSPAPEDGWGRIIVTDNGSTDTLTPRTDDMLTMKSFGSGDAILPKTDDATKLVTNNLSDTEVLTPMVNDVYGMITNRLSDTESILPKISDLYKMITNRFTKTDAVQYTVNELIKMSNIHTVMNGDSRQVFGKVEILYTDPLIDGTISVATPDNNALGSGDQLYDGKTQPEYQWFSLANNKLDGSFHCPDPDSTVGWWGATLSNADGTFNTPQVVSISFNPRPIDKIVVVGDSKDNNYPVDFDVILYRPDNSIAYTQTVRGNTNVNYTQAIAAVGNITKMDLKIYKISKQSVCKVLEFFSLITVTYMDDDIADIHLLEELAYEDSGVPLGAISSNEIDISLVNKDRMFDLSNTDSPLYNALRKNRKVTAWLGAKVVDDIEWHKLGVFWTTSWKAPFSDVNAALVARDKLELLRSDTFETSQLYVNYTLYQLYDLLFSSYGLTSAEYQIDPALQTIILPYAWFERTTYREALSKLSKCTFVHVYCNHDGIIIVKVPGTTNIRTTTFTMDDNILDFDFPMSSTNITNSVEVLVNTLTPDVPNSIYSGTDSIAIPPNSTQDITCIYNSIPNINIQAPTIVKDTGINIMGTQSYVWGVIITVQNTTAQALNVTSVDIQGSPLKTTGTNSVIAEDSLSVQTEGRARVSVDNEFVQTQDYANYLATTLLNVFTNQKADISTECRGDVAVGVGEDINITTNYAQDVPYTVVRQDIEWNGALSAQIECKKF